MCNTGYVLVANTNLDKMLPEWDIGGKKTNMEEYALQHLSTDFHPKVARVRYCLEYIYNIDTDWCVHVKILWLSVKICWDKSDHFIYEQHLVYYSFVLNYTRARITN